MIMNRKRKTNAKRSLLMAATATGGNRGPSSINAAAIKGGDRIDYKDTKGGGRGNVWWRRRPQRVEEETTKGSGRHNEEWRKKS